MAKLSKAQAKAHRAACELLLKDVLTLDEREFVINNWQESATHSNGEAGAFFTPLEMAETFAVEVGGHDGFTLIDLCAGIGCLSYVVWARSQGWSGGPSRIVCVEKNPDYVAVGRKVLPEAEWICADVFDLPDLGRFSFAISNPPFGSGGPVKGVSLDLNVVAVAAQIADHGVFILPQASSPFRYSGEQGFKAEPGKAYEKFHDKTGHTLEPNCGIDCDQWRGDWRGVAPKVEICTADFPRKAQVVQLHRAAQLELFAEAA